MSLSKFRVSLRRVLDAHSDLDDGAKVASWMVDGMRGEAALLTARAVECGPELLRLMEDADFAPAPEPPTKGDQLASIQETLRSIEGYMERYFAERNRGGS